MAISGAMAVSAIAHEMILPSSYGLALKAMCNPAHPSSREPTLQWLAELPSLCEPECSVMLQSKSLGRPKPARPHQLVQEVRRVQEQARRVSRAFAELCR
jgi:hypothetical protein